MNLFRSPVSCTEGRQHAASTEIVIFTGEQIHRPAGLGIKMRGIGIVRCVKGNDHCLAVVSAAEYKLFIC